MVRSTKVFVDGVDKTTAFKEPFIHNGTTYVSLRDVGEALGQEIHWDGKTQSIYIGSRPTTLTITETDLTSKIMTATSQIFLYRLNNRAEPAYNLDNDAGFVYAPDYSMRIMMDPNEVVTTTFESGISMKAYNDYSSIHYALNGQYDFFKGTVGYDYVLNNGVYTNYDVNIIVDSEVVKTIHLTQEHVYEEFEVSVIDGQKLKLEFVRPDSSDINPFINIVNPTLESHVYN